MSWIADGEIGSSVRAKLNAVINNGTSEDKTTGASPVNADNTKSVTRITSGGTEDDEDIVLPDFTLDANGVNAEKNGTVHVFVLDTQTSEDDVVRVYAGTQGTNVRIADATGQTSYLAQSEIDGIVLDAPGQSATLVWKDVRWYWDNSTNNNDADKTYPSVWLPRNPSEAYIVSYINGVPVWTGLASISGYGWLIADGGLVPGIYDVYVDGNGRISFRQKYGGTLDAWATPYTLGPSDEGLFISHINSEELEVLNLPTALEGISYEIYVQDTFGIRINAASGDQIRIAASLSATEGFVKSTVIGSFLKLIALSADEWVAVSVVGTWTVDS